MHSDAGPSGPGTAGTEVCREALFVFDTNLPHGESGEVILMSRWGGGGHTASEERKWPQRETCLLPCIQFDF